MTLKNNSRIASRDCVELANFTQEIKYLLGQLFRGLGILLFNLFASSNELALSTGLLGAGNTLDFRNLSTFRASMSADLPPRFVLISAAILPQILLNIPLSITLLTHGGAFLFMLWYLTPRTMFERQASTQVALAH